MSSDPTQALRQPTRLRDAYRFFVPLMFMSELMMISHVIINAFLARMTNPEPILAAYGVAFGCQTVLGAPVWACSIVFLSFIKDRASVRKLIVFGFQTFFALLWLWLILALMPVGQRFFEVTFGLSPEIARDAQLCLFIGMFIPPITVFRSMAYGILMVERRTAVVTFVTLVRLAGLAVILAILTRWFDGAAVGMYALLGCISVETIVAVAVALPAYLRRPVQAELPPPYRELWRFSWPVMVMQIAESGVALAAHFFLGRLPNAVTALAGFTVLDSIMRLMLSPLRNLIHTTQTLVHTRADGRVIILFGFHMALLFGAFVLLFNVPAFRTLTLDWIMGLPADMAEYITPALRVSLLLALCMAAAAATRGFLIASKNTGVIAVSSAVRICAVALTGTVALTVGAENGAMVGLAALTFAFGAEAVVLGVRLWQLERRPPGLFGERRAAA
ncbi:MAG: hypothetical protein AAF458_24935 [Pseudomonadota bacterium]